jgi:hypothetical protein
MNKKQDNVISGRANSPISDLLIGCKIKQDENINGLVTSANDDSSHSLAREYEYV